MRRFGERAFAGHFDIEISLGLNGTQPDHSHSGPGHNRGAEMPVKLHNGCQPCRIGRLADGSGAGATRLLRGRGLQIRTARSKRYSDSWLGHHFPLLLNELNVMRDVGGHSLPSVYIPRRGLNRNLE